MLAQGDTIESCWFEARGENQGQKEGRNKDVKKVERRKKKGERKDVRERKGTWRRKEERKLFFCMDYWHDFDRAGEAGHKVEKTVSITPGTHWRIICWGWVNCDLRSVMTCNNFLSLLSVSRQGRSPQQGKGCRDVGRNPNKWEGTNCVMWEATTTIKSIICVSKQ